MNELFCQVQHEGETLALIIDVDPEDGGAELLVSRNHFTKERSVTRKEFPSLQEAQAHCEAKYGVVKGDWGESPEFEYTFKFKYSVCNWTRVPSERGFKNARLAVTVSPSTAETADLSAQPTKVDIAGNVTGLKMLAARLIICSDSEDFDDLYHRHMNAPGSNLELTIHGPGYMEHFEKEGQGDLSLLYEEE